MKFISAFFALLLIISMPTLSFAKAQSDYELGLVAFSEKKYKEAIQHLNFAAIKGNLNAQYKLGEIYQYGEGTNIDYTLAMKWYNNAAKLGSSIAQHHLGAIYEFGLMNIKIQYETAFEWYRLSAEQGNSDAQYAIAGLYAQGLGTTLNNEKALYWYHKSAKQGNSSAHLTLGLIYSGGMLDVLEDKIIGLKWSLIAYKQDELLSERVISSIRKNMTNEQIEKAQQLANECAIKNFKHC